MNKAIFVDVDGTLLDSVRNYPTITKKSIYAIKELIKNGDFVFVSSGRCKCMLPENLMAAKPNGFLTCNGSYCELNGEIIVSRFLDIDNAKKVKEYCDKHKHNYYFETQEYLYTGLNDMALHERFVNAWDMTGVCVKDNGLKEGYIFMVVLDNEDECKKFYKEFIDIFDVRRHNGFTSFDVNEYGINKGYGVTETLKYLNISKEDAYAFGDGMNDIEMIKAVKYGFAMGNAEKEVKEVAYDVVGDVMEDGFYYALVKYGLIKPMNE